MPRWIKNIGRRGASLAFFALLFLVTGVNMIQYSGLYEQSPNLHHVMQILPAWLWGWVWVGAALISLVSAFWHKLSDWAFSLSAFILFVWSGGYLTSWILGDGQRPWIGLVTYVAFGAYLLIVAGWDENRRKG